MASLPGSGGNMRKTFFLLVTLLLAGTVFANDTYFFTSGGNLIPAEEKNISIQMKSEVITIVLQPDYYEITVDLNFYNTGKTTELLVGFPFFEAGIGGHGKIYDFKCWTNGELKDYSDMPLIREFSNHNYNAENLENAYTRTITFPAKKSTSTKVNYKSEYGFDTDGQIIKYLYGTGSSWKGSIGEITVILENNLPYARPNEFELPKGKSTPFTRIADNKWEAHFYKIEPKYTDCITIHTGNILDDTGPKCFPSYFKFNRVKAEKDWLFWYTRPQLRIVRNALYALHGYNFKSADLKELFTEWGKYWYPEYTVNPAFTENELSDIEKYNIQLILTEEESRSK